MIQGGVFGPQHLILVIPLVMVIMHVKVIVSDANALAQVGFSHRPTLRSVLNEICACFALLIGEDIAVDRYLDFATIVL